MPDAKRRKPPFPRREEHHSQQNQARRSGFRIMYVSSPRKSTRPESPSSPPNEGMGAEDEHRTAQHRFFVFPME